MLETIHVGAHCEALLPQPGVGTCAKGQQGQDSTSGWEGATDRAGLGEDGRDITQMERRNLDILIEDKTDGQVPLLLSLLPLSAPHNRQQKTF